MHMMLSLEILLNGNMLNLNIKTKHIILSVFILLAFLERVFIDFGPNIELITMTMITSAAYVGRKETFLVTFLLLIASDLVIGNSNIFLFTWSGFLIPSLYAHRFIRNHKVVEGTMAGMGANIFFFIWTNFGVWLIGKLYPPSLSGLVTSYINALPFLKLQLISTLVFVPIGFLAMEFTFDYKKIFDLKVVSYQRVLLTK